VKQYCGKKKDEQNLQIAKTINHKMWDKKDCQKPKIDIWNLIELEIGYCNG
jgi:hypothetical protein